jgi:Inner membrane component of T3SS, cytoplasmic domain
MSMNYFIEILNHHGDVIRRESFAALPIRIGRAYSNDVIIDDPHMAAEHAIIDTNGSGEIILQDLGSQNGIYQQHQRRQEFTVTGDQVYRLGQTALRIRTREYSVAQELTYITNDRWGRWPQALIALIAISLFALATSWLNNVEESNRSEYLTAMFGLLGLAALWAGLFALANRVFGGAAHFSRHLFIFCVGVMTVDLFDYVGAFLDFGFSWEWLSQYGSHLQIAILACMIYFHLRQISPRKEKLLKMICLTLSLVGSGFLLLKNQQETNQYGDQLYSHVMLPHTMRFSRNHSVSEFEDNMHELKVKIDAERARVAKTRSKSE